jgi:hypothetical protein
VTRCMPCLSRLKCLADPGWLLGTVRICRVHAVHGSGDGHHGVLGIKVIMHELRRAADRSWRFRSIFDCRGVEGSVRFRPVAEPVTAARPLSGRSLHCPSRPTVVGRHRGVRELTVIRGQVVEAGRSC